MRTSIRLMISAMTVCVALVPALPADAAWAVALAAGSTGEAKGRILPGVPTGVTATCAGNNKITIAWTPTANAGTSPATTFTVTPSTGSPVTGLAGTSYLRTAVAAGTYTHTVRSVTGTSWASAVSAATASRTIAANGTCS